MLHTHTHIRTKTYTQTHTHTLKLKPIFAKLVLMFQTLQTIALFKQPAHLAASTKTYLKRILHSLSVVSAQALCRCCTFCESFAFASSLRRTSQLRVVMDSLEGYRKIASDLLGKVKSLVAKSREQQDTVKKRRFVWEINFGSRSGLP